MWVPYGMHAFSIGLEDVNHMLFIPVAYDGLLQSVEKKTLDSLTDFNVKFLEETVDKDMKEMGTGFRRWLARAH